MLEMIDVHVDRGEVGIGWREVLEEFANPSVTRQAGQGVGMTCLEDLFLERRLEQVQRLDDADITASEAHEDRFDSCARASAQNQPRRVASCRLFREQRGGRRKFGRRSSCVEREPELLGEYLQ